MTELILLHPPPPLVGASIVMWRERQHNDRTPAGGAQATQQVVPGRKAGRPPAPKAPAPKAGRPPAPKDAAAKAAAVKAAAAKKIAKKPAVRKVSHGLQLRSLWRIPTVAVGESWLTAAIPMENPCGSFRLTRGGRAEAGGEQAAGEGGGEKRGGEGRARRVCHRECDGVRR